MVNDEWAGVGCSSRHLLWCHSGRLVSLSRFLGNDTIQSEDGISGKSIAARTISAGDQRTSSFEMNPQEGLTHSSEYMRISRSVVSLTRALEGLRIMKYSGFAMAVVA